MSSKLATALIGIGESPRKLRQYKADPTGFLRQQGVTDIEICAATSGNTMAINNAISSGSSKGFFAAAKETIHIF